MCGRFSLSTPAQTIASIFKLNRAPVLLTPRYNIAPTQPVAVVRCLDSASVRTLDLLRWGLIPPWAKDPSIGASLINARSESAASKPAFRDAIRKRRCVIPADGFYEWRRIGDAKQPYSISTRQGGPMAMAGVWEQWIAPTGDAIESCAILTTTANATLAPIHNRMPVILSLDACDQWLDPAARDVDLIEPLLQPAPYDWLIAAPVSRRVNNIRHDDARCIEPVDPLDDAKLF